MFPVQTISREVAFMATPQRLYAEILNSKLIYSEHCTMGHSVVIKDFDIFCQLMAKIEKGDHLTEKGLKSLYNLKKLMH